jgi:hypothetical protein
MPHSRAFGLPLHGNLVRLHQLLVAHYAQRALRLIQENAI